MHLCKDIIYYIPPVKPNVYKKAKARSHHGRHDEEQVVRCHERVRRTSNKRSDLINDRGAGVLRFLRVWHDSYARRNDQS